MARIQLRNTEIFFQDGLTGTALVNDVAGIVETDTSATIDAVLTNADDSSPAAYAGVPVGARFTFAGDTQVYTVETVDSESATLDITLFSPAKNDTVVADDAVITFLPQQIEIKIGEGDVSWSETKEYIYDRDRDLLDTVRDGQEQPMSVDMAFTFDFITAGSSAVVPTPSDALKRKGQAANWVSSSADKCEPYCIDIIIRHCVPCGADEDQLITLPEFRQESLDYSIADASVATSGQCNATEVVTSRLTNPDCA
jgi:hypothetical protein